jgi:hypothetical protein
MASNVVDCLWWDHNTGSFYQTSSHQPLEVLLATVGRHLAQNLYSLGTNLIATPSSLHIIMTSRTSTHSVHDVRLALEFAAHPSLLSTFSPAQQQALVGMNILLSDGSVAPFPTLCTTNFPDLSETQQQAVASHTSTEQSFADEAAALEDPKTVGLFWLNTTSIPGVTEPWAGTFAGIDRGYGPRSRTNWMVAEIGRQVGKGFYNVSSLSACASEVRLVVKCDIKDQDTIWALFELIKVGGQALNTGEMEHAKSLGLL